MQSYTDTHMNEQRSSTIIDGRGRQIILNVHKYFEEEKVQCRLLLQRITSLTYDKEEVRVPMPIFTDVVKHLRTAIQVSKRVAAATLINKNSLTKIKREGAAAMASSTKLKTPKRKPRGSKAFFNQDDLDQLESIVKSLMSKQQQDFKFNMLLSVVRRDLNYTGSLATLRRILQEMGFRWKKKPGSMFVTLIDKVDSNKLEATNMEVTLDNNSKSCTEYEEYLEEDIFETEENYSSEDSEPNMDSYRYHVDYENQKEMCTIEKTTKNINETETKEQPMPTNKDVDDIEVKNFLGETDNLVSCGSNNGIDYNDPENSTSTFAIMQYLKLDPSIDHLEEDVDIEVCHPKAKSSILEPP